MFINAKQFQTYLNQGHYARVRSYYRRALDSPEARARYYATLTLKESRELVTKIKQAIVNRDTTYIVHSANGIEGATLGISKWVRPCEIVPELVNFCPPEGDFGVGVEVEFGFTSLTAAQQVANHVKNWKYITLDYEGGDNPIEVTFPPVLYSKLNKKSQVNRYLDYLAANDELVYKHTPALFVGIHINVSCPRPVCHMRDTALQTVLIMLSGGYMGNLGSPEQQALCKKYFGRNPYNLNVRQADGKYIEFKMFNSVTDRKVLKRYIDISVALMMLLDSNIDITRASVLHAITSGYAGKPSLPLVVAPQQPVLNESSTVDASNFALAA